MKHFEPKRRDMIFRKYSMLLMRIIIDGKSSYF